MKLHNQPRAMQLKRLVIAFAVTAGVLLGGCKPQDTEVTQVIARVDNDEVTIHQLNLALTRIKRKDLSESERDAVLEKLIDRQLLKRRAQQIELDRRPEVMTRIEEARLDIIAAAYAEELAANAPPISEDTVTKYYRNHPSLFAQRRLYRLREITVPVGKGKDTSVIDHLVLRLSKGDRTADLLNWLNKQPGTYFDQLALRPADDLPVDIADALVKLKQGETFVSRTSDALVIYEIQGFEAAPIKWTTAAPSIYAYLKKQQAIVALEAELKHLRSAAKIAKS